MASALHLEPLLLPIFPTREVISPMKSFTKSEDILAATKSDKKMEQGTIKFILLESVGHAVVDRTVTDEEMLEAINSINGDLIDEE